MHNSNLTPPTTDLRYSEISLQFLEIVPSNVIQGLVPFYKFRILDQSDTAVGHINFRVGDTEHITQVVGHLGYAILEPFRGHSYAYQAVRAIAPLVRTTYKNVIITCNPDNLASKRTIEKLGAVFINIVAVPDYDPHYASGSRFKLRYLWRVE